MKKTYLILVVVVALFLATALFYFKYSASMASKLVVQPIDNKGIFVGEKQPMTNHPDDYAKQTKAIDDAWDNMSIGDSYFKSGRYEEAATAYKKAYSIGEKAVNGLLLAKTYEKLGRYDDGINLLNDMIKNHELSEKGVQNASAIKSRLLSAKNQSTAQ